jgi:hypothetical protein
MLARGLVEILPTRAGWRAVFTEAGRATLRDMAQDRRALDSARFPRQRAELGLDQANGADAVTAHPCSIEVRTGTIKERYCCQS